MTATGAIRGGWSLVLGLCGLGVGGAAVEPGALPAIKLGIIGAHADPFQRDVAQEDGVRITAGCYVGAMGTWRDIDPALRGAGDTAHRWEADALAVAWGRIAVARTVWVHAVVDADTLRPIPFPGMGTDRWGMTVASDGDWQAGLQEGYVGGTCAASGTTLRVGRLTTWLGLPDGNQAASWRLRPSALAWNQGTPDGARLDQGCGTQWIFSGLVARQVVAADRPASSKDPQDLAYGLGATWYRNRGWLAVAGVCDVDATRQVRTGQPGSVWALSVTGVVAIGERLSAFADLGAARNPDTDQGMVHVGLAQGLPAGCTATLQTQVVGTRVHDGIPLHDRTTSETTLAVFWTMVRHLTVGVEGSLIRTDASAANGASAAGQVGVVF